jgi:hypothetical protein
MKIKNISTYKINKSAKNIIASIEEYMDKSVSVSLAKSMVKFWLCTCPNPILVKNKYISPPKNTKEAADNLSKRLHSPELMSLIKLYGTKAECNIMYKVYAHFYNNSDNSKDGAIFGGGFLYDVIKAKATGKSVIKSW